jgi:hypothetical protein
VICSANCKTWKTGTKALSLLTQGMSSLTTNVRCFLKKSSRWLAWLSFYIKAYDNREITVGEGFSVAGVHFDVHRFHPPLIYGRRGGPEDGEGIALCRVWRNDQIKPNVKKGDEIYQYLLITYLLPILSAKAVPQMVKFAEQHSKKSNAVGTPEW